MIFGLVVKYLGHLPLYLLNPANLQRSLFAFEAIQLWSSLLLELEFVEALILFQLSQLLLDSSVARLFVQVNP